MLLPHQWQQGVGSGRCKVVRSGGLAGGLCRGRIKEEQTFAPCAAADNLRTVLSGPFGHLLRVQNLGRC